MGRVSNKVAIVTGSASGLGNAVAELLAKEGAIVIAADIDEKNGTSRAEEIVKSGGRCEFHKLDVSSESDWNTLIKITEEKYDNLDILVNCAGVFFNSSIADLTLENWRWVMSINLDGVFLGTKYGAEVMKKSGGGSIINFSSVGGLVGTVDSSVYNASKGGVRLFTKAAALEFSKEGHDYNIRVNSVHPGVIDTPMTKPMIAENGDEMADWAPIGRYGEPSDVAYAVLYLASDESKFVTGSEMVIDGGWSAK